MRPGATTRCPRPDEPTAPYEATGLTLPASSTSTSKPVLAQRSLTPTNRKLRLVAKALVSSGTAREGKAIARGARVPRIRGLGGLAGSGLLPNFAGLKSGPATAGGWVVPCIHENALLLVDGLDDGRAEDAAGLAGGEQRVSSAPADPPCLRVRPGIARSLLNCPADASRSRPRGCRCC